jgi:hypothetical protein
MRRGAAALVQRLGFNAIARFGVLVQFFLGLIPSVEIFAHTGAGILLRAGHREGIAAWYNVLVCRTYYRTRS